MKGCLGMDKTWKKGFKGVKGGRTPEVRMPPLMPTLKPGYKMRDCNPYIGVHSCTSFSLL